MKSIKILKTLNNLTTLNKINLIKLKIQAFSTVVQSWLEIESRLAKTQGELVLMKKPRSTQLHLTSFNPTSEQQTNKL